MKVRRIILAATIVATSMNPHYLRGEDSSETINALKQRLEELEQKVQMFEQQRLDDLEQKVKIIDHKRELDQEAAAEKAKTAPTITAGANGFSFRSADTNFVLKIRGYLQADGRFYADDYPGGTVNDTFLIRRARPILEGTVYEKYDFRFMLDFASGINSAPANNSFLQDGYLNARFLPEFQVQVGKFKEPVGLERLQSGANLLFVERGYPTQLVPNRDVGLQLQGDLFKERLRYEAGIFNGVADGASGDVDASDDEKDIAGRLFATPFKNSNVAALRGLGFGVAGTYGNQEGAGLVSKYKSPGQQQFFAYRSGDGTAAKPNVVADGSHYRIAPQGYYYWGPFGLLGEYVISDQRLRRDAGGATFARAQNTAWQAAVSYVLTGEPDSWKGFTPRHPFNPANGGWGAWQIAARIGQFAADDQIFAPSVDLANPAISARGATSWAVGLNWYLNKNVKLNFDYEQTDFTGGTSAFLQQGEKVFLTRAQVSF